MGALAFALWLDFAAAQDEASMQTVWDFLKAGGPVMVPLGLCSVVAVALVMERSLRLRRRLVFPEPVETAVGLARGGRYTDALAAARGANAPAGRILAAGLVRVGMPVREVELAMEDQAAKEADRMRGNVRWLSLIASVSPLLGLLGTVLGIEDSFHRVVQTGMGKPEHLAAGIEEALITTIAGLIIAIPALLLAAYLNAKVRRLLADVDDGLQPVVEHLVEQERKGHAA
jgi:biopolymer transport protein ExbB